ncbi:type II toxin-antitoxin system RelE/ParE family toxin [Candidatus Thalassolituus haligoni]|uniref:type II toxin-antitoxin system RelE/ParE family toxin n=1 Tax=Candidatus Thalassolituus haligoni TaxID=3100113 RepID=UPI003511A134|tara:strand:+ start:407 stop:721 length:315 start_codon:yes stop_codon:yes gene_type:complete
MREALLYPQAEADLESIWRYTQSTWGTAQANRYIDEFDENFAVLADNPLICRERTEYTPTLRIYRHAHHLIVYVHTETTLEVIRILHENMDVDRQLNVDDLTEM